MNIGYQNKYLDIKVYKDKTKIDYFNNDVLSFSHQYPIGTDHISVSLVSDIVMSDWISGVVYTLHNISLVDRVPTQVFITTEKYGTVFEKFIRHPVTYSQFYIEPTNTGKGVHVIIKKINYLNSNSLIEDAEKVESNLSKNNPANKKDKIYERYTKTISQFKI